MNKRIDKERIEYVGGVLINEYDWITSTGVTDDEDYFSDLIVNDNSGKTNQIEIKTIKKGITYKSKYIDMMGNDWPSTPWWFLNKTTKTGSEKGSKWDKLTNGAMQGIVFLTHEGLYLFTPKTLKQAYMGDCRLYQTHTAEFDDDSKSWETKAMIDLSKGKYIICDPNEELFN